jgi:hypothetical protein
LGNLVEAVGILILLPWAGGGGRDTAGAPHLTTSPLLLCNLTPAVRNCEPDVIVDVSCYVCVIIDNHIRLNYLMFCYYARLWLWTCDCECEWFGCCVQTGIFISIHMLTGLQFSCIIYLFTYILLYHSYLHANYVECLETGKVLPFLKMLKHKNCMRELVATLTLYAFLNLGFFNVLSACFFSLCKFTFLLYFLELEWSSQMLPKTDKFHQQDSSPLCSHVHWLCSCKPEHPH